MHNLCDFKLNELIRNMEIILFIEARALSGLGLCHQNELNLCDTKYEFLAKFQSICCHINSQNWIMNEIDNF